MEEEKNKTTKKKRMRRNLVPESQGERGAAHTAATVNEERKRGRKWV